jgi:hypothetical protein
MENSFTDRAAAFHHSQQFSDLFLRGIGLHTDGQADFLKAGTDARIGIEKAPGRYFSTSTW